MPNPSPGTPPTIAIRFIRGTEAEITASAANGALDTGEPIWAVDTQRLYVATASNAVALIGPSTSIPLQEYFRLLADNTATGNNTFTGQNAFNGATRFGVSVSPGGTPSIWPTVAPNAVGGNTMLDVTDDSNRLATTAWIRALLNSSSLPPGIAMRNLPNTFTSQNTFTEDVTFRAPVGVVDGGSYLGINDFSGGSIRVPTRPISGPYDSNAASTKFVADFINSGAGGFAKLSASNSYAAGIDNDFSLTSSLRAPRPGATWGGVTSGDTNVPTLGWLKDNLPTSANLLTANNTWTGANAFSVSPTVGTPLPPTDSSNKVATTSWVQSAVNSAVSGALLAGRPSLSKSLSQPNTLEWTAGSVYPNGFPVSISMGSYAYSSAGTFYVKASATGVVNATAVSPTLSPGETLLGTVNVVPVGSNFEISTVVPAPINADYAIRSAANTFTSQNIFVAPPRGTYTISGADEDNGTLATTEWVMNKLAAGGGFFELSGGNVRLLPSVTGCLDLTASCLLAPHPDPSDKSNAAATTAWVQSLISGVPLAPQVSPGNGLNVLYTAGTVKLPTGVSCSGSSCMGGDTCNISAGGLPINTTTRYIYVRYSDCMVVASDTLLASNQHALLAHIQVSGGTPTWVVTVDNVTSSVWAPIHSPYFTGVPKAPRPPEGDDSDNIATTGWVRDAVEEGICPLPPSDRPQVIDAGGLNINVTSGNIPKLESLGGGLCTVGTLSNPLGVNASTTEYIWVRYSDCKVVASTLRPHSSLGDVIGIVVTGPTDIISITQVGLAGGVLETCITAHYGVGFGGYLVYQPAQ